MQISQLLSAPQHSHSRSRGDRNYVTSCTRCGFITTLNELRLVQWGESTRYVCPLCSTIVVAIEPADEEHPGFPGGVRVGGYVIQAKSDITLSYAGGPPAIAGVHTAQF